ncbi:hypothetical protein CLV98_106135 [Dyadobacter jejuensis]|uniref:Uncharacterized protein n=1 Tax=Dyadobacter jejuensis TaxID=1082580 RepID=A0A316AIV2_9BACT|nr:hypothetical protein [Dyadobacter jejuensis]PWJ57663.1 hypothetical protein CLV98_106135 [Dyadobacter jejuensis]
MKAQEPSQYYYLMKHTLLILLMIGGIFACQPKTSQTDQIDVEGHHAHSSEHVEGDPRAAEVMAIHDSIMPRMEDIMTLKARVQRVSNELDSLSAPSPALKKKKSTSDDLVKKLEEADQKMMGWMHQYNADTLNQLDEKAAADYIDQQKVKIVDVKRVMEQAILEAQDFLGERK